MNYSRTVITVFAAVLTMPFMATAATISLSPTTVSVTPGQTFTITVSANPTASETLYTVKADISFDPALLEATNFTFASNWMPLSQSGYDAMDNTKGTLTKTGGYPGGITRSTVLGTATFRAKAAGTATLVTTSNSLALNKTSTNALSGTQGSVTVTAARPTPAAPAPVNENENSNSSGTNAGGTTAGNGNTGNGTVAGAVATNEDASVALATTTDEQDAAEEDVPETQLAAAAIAGMPWWLWSILIALLIAGGLWLMVARRRS